MALYPKLACLAKVSKCVILFTYRYKHHSQHKGLLVDYPLWWLTIYIPRSQCRCTSCKDCGCWGRWALGAGSQVVGIPIGYRLPESCSPFCISVTPVSLVIFNTVASPYLVNYLFKIAAHTKCGEAEDVILLPLPPQRLSPFL